MHRRIVFVLLASFAFTQPLFADDSQSIAVVTYNIRYANPNDGSDIWSNRKEAVAKYLSPFDLMGLQEVTLAQLQFLREHLPQHASYGVGRDDGKSGGEHAPIFYRKDRFKMEGQGTFWLSAAPDQPGSKGWDAALPRTCTWMQLRDKETDKLLVVANTHFDHRGKKAREESGKLIVQRLTEQFDDLPIVLLGDFNCLAQSAPYDAIVSELTDARDATIEKPAGPSSTWNGFKEIIPNRIIDHVFIRNIKVERLDVTDPKTDQGRFASDHLPVEVVVLQQ